MILKSARNFMLLVFAWAIIFALVDCAAQISSCQNADVEGNIEYLGDGRWAMELNYDIARGRVSLVGPGSLSMSQPLTGTGRTRFFRAPAEWMQQGVSLNVFVVTKDGKRLCEQTNW